MKNKIVKIIILIFILIILSLLVWKYFDKPSEVYDNDDNMVEDTQYDEIFSDVKVEVSDYFIYGTHFGLQGSLDINEYGGVDQLKYQLILLDKNTKEEIDIEFISEVNDGILKFKISELLDKGMNLDNIPNSEYIFYIKITNEANNTIYYHSMKNNTNYKDLDYYTITKNNSNNYIKIYWENDNLNLSCVQCKLPEDVYDIVIDQGHGGSAKGACENGYVEAEVNFECGIRLKEELEKLGLKVLVTRTDKNQYVSEYGNDGRAVIPHKVRAKYCFSIHNNYSVHPERDGVEIYAPKFVNLEFAQSLADNIVNIANSTYSQNTVGKVSNGVYVLTFSQEDVEDTKNEARYRGYEPYNVTTDTMYFFMIREVGGRLTGGYVDGRDTRIEKNPYWNSINVAEAYLLELGYVSNFDDINNVVNNMDSYISAIVKSIKNKLSI